MMENDKAGENAEKEKTPFEKFQALTQQVIRVPKAEVDKRIAARKKNKTRRKR